LVQSPQFACKIWCHLHCVPLCTCLPLLPPPPFFELTLPTLNKTKPHRNCANFCRPTILLMKCNTAAESAMCPSRPSEEQLINWAERLPCMSVADPDMLTSTSDLQNEKEQMQRAWSTDRRSACDALSHALVKDMMSSVLSEAQNASGDAAKQV